MITDFDDAYANAPYIAGSEGFAGRCAAAAAAFRAAMADEDRAEMDRPYGAAERERFDLFLPAGAAAGLLVFVHGGYWKAFDKSDWSHLAAGGLANGWAVCLPGYTLAPAARIAAITRQVAAGITAASDRIAGPIVLAGHSAGGHLATRMICRGGPLPAEVAARIRRTVSISGVHDLRPLLRTRMNAILGLDEAEAAAESPALQNPAGTGAALCWVGADERPEFIRQADLLANIWFGLGAEIESRHTAGRHHFDVIDDLADPGSELLRLALR
jgi:arylformamidase